MKQRILALISAAFFIATAQAATPEVLTTGDRLELAAGEAFTVAELRSALRDYGYYGFMQGDHTGRIIKITAYGPDKKLYRLKVRSTTGEVTHARQLRHLF